MADESSPSDQPLSPIYTDFLSTKVNALVAQGGVSCPHCGVFVLGNSIGELAQAAALHEEVCTARD